MRRMFARSVAVVLTAGLLAGCSSDDNQPESFSNQIFGSVKEIVATRREGPRQKTVVTPEMLAQTTTAALQVNPEARGGSDFLRRVAARTDSSIGAVEIWNSSDSAQIFLRNGVVVGTRGIGGDIIAADASVTVRSLQNRSGASGKRNYIVSDGDNTTTDYNFRCDLTNLGTENISIVNLLVATNHIQENCVGGPSGTAVVQNDYWVQNGTGLVRKSRQWMGPRTGYFELILLKN